jgi:hypothetical protein
MESGDEGSGDEGSDGLRDANLFNLTLDDPGEAPAARHFKGQYAEHLSGRCSFAQATKDDRCCSCCYCIWFAGYTGTQASIIAKWVGTFLTSVMMQVTGGRLGKHQNFNGADPELCP